MARQARTELLHFVVVLALVAATFYAAWRLVWWLE
jgi:hypothetical protein